MNKLMIIDGHSLMFRMYYAFLRRPMVNSKGVDTSIIFGFTKYLLELIAKESPTHLGVAFDPPTKTFRHEFYPLYKANRDVSPEVVKNSLDPLIQIVRSLDIPVLMVPGYEADDVIGSMSAKWGNSDFKVIMVSPDKDLGQLVNDFVFQFKPGKSGAENEILGKKEICEKFEISDPKQIIDILAIWGDAVDNIPGVRGIGEVGAKKLVSQFGGVEQILDNIDKLPAKQAANISESLENLKISKYLSTIKTDIDLPFTENDLKVSIHDTSKAKMLLTEYECFSLIPLLPSSKSQEKNITGEAIKHEKKVKFDIVSADEFAQSAEKSRKIGISIKAKNIRDNNVLMILSTVKNDKTLICKNPAINKLKGIFENENIEKTGYNLKFIINYLKNINISLKGYLADIEIMHYMLNPEISHRLDILAFSYLSVNIDLECENFAPSSEKESYDLFNQPDPKSIDTECLKNEIETALLIPLKEAVLNDMKKNESAIAIYDKIEKPLICILAAMELNGFKIDTEMLAQYGEELDKVLQESENKIRKMAEDPDLNISSPVQLGKVLFEKMKLDPKVKKNRRGNYSTDEETLTGLKEKHSIIKEILYFREIKKLLSTYIEPFPTLIDSIDGKVHTTFNQALTATGRLSSSHPNLQNIPIRSELGKEIRKAFIASDPDNVIISADYSQIELRIMAELSKDPNMIDAFNHGLDIHTATAARIFKEDKENVTPDQRRMAKTANFGIIYGISAFGLSQRLGIARSEAKKLIEDYFANYPGIADYIEKMKRTAREKGFVTTMFGRKRFLKDINSRNANVRGFAERNAVNAPIQGSAADIIKMAMINIDKAFKANGLKSKMILQVHDELIFDAPNLEKEIVMKVVKTEMENVIEMKVPLIVECSWGKNWLEAH